MASYNQNNSLSEALAMHPLSMDAFSLMLSNYDSDIQHSSSKSSMDPEGKFLKQWKETNKPYFLGKRLSENHKNKKSSAMKAYHNSNKGIKRNKGISEKFKKLGICPPPNKHTKGTKWWNDGTKNVRALLKPGDDFTPGRISWSQKNNAL